MQFPNFWRFFPTTLPCILAFVLEKIFILIYLYDNWFLNFFRGQSDSHNLKYMGIDALGRLIKISPEIAEQHQLAVIDCLEVRDIIIPFCLFLFMLGSAHNFPSFLIYHFFFIDYFDIGFLSDLLIRSAWDMRWKVRDIIVRLWNDCPLGWCSYLSWWHTHHFSLSPSLSVCVCVCLCLVCP